ncbi:MAG: hypothetical protein J6U54_06320 [Clostridiales bacterium]|nr:hypothetical protein [Clostridiales bacterium]
MRSYVKRFTSVLVIGSIAFSLFGCGMSKKENKKIVTSAEEVMEALLSCKTKDIKELGYFSGNSIDLIKEISEDEAVVALLKEAEIEVDELSIETKKKITYCDVEIELPNYSEILENQTKDIELFMELVDEQDKDDYTTIELNLEFEKEDGEYQLTNGDEVVEDLFTDMTNELSVLTYIETPVEPTEPTDDPFEEEEYTLLYQDSYVTVKFVELAEDGVHLEIQNDTDAELYFHPFSFSINKISLNDLDVEGKLGPDCTAEMVLKGDFDPDMKVGTVSGFIYISTLDRNTSFEPTFARFCDVVIDEAVDVKTPELEGTLIYEDEKVRLAFKETREDTIVFSVENLTYENERFGPQALAINGRGLEDYDWQDYQSVAPQSVGEIKFKCEVDSGMEVGVISGKFSMSIFDTSKGKEGLEYVFFDGIVDDSIEVSEGPEGVLMYENDSVKVSFKEITSKGVVLDVQNLTDTTISYIVDCISVNRKSYITMSSTDVTPHSCCNLLVECDVDADEKVGEISGYFRVGFEDGRDSLRFSINTVEVDNSVKITDVTPEGPLLYQDGKVKIYYKELTDKGICFEVENMSDMTWAMQSGVLNVNGTNYNEIIMSDPIAPHSTGVATAKMTLSDSSVETISGELKVVDLTKFESYTAKIRETEI